VDSESVGMAIATAGAALLFGASLFGVLIGYTVGQYGSVPVATVVSGVGFVALLVGLLGLRGRLSWIDPGHARTAGISYSLAGMLLMNPLPGTPLPFGQLMLVSVIGSVLGGSLLLFAAVDREALGTA